MTWRVHHIIIRSSIFFCALILVVGCTHFFKPTNMAYAIPDPQAVLACFNSSGGACGTTCGESSPQPSTVTWRQLAESSTNLQESITAATQLNASAAPSGSRNSNIKSGLNAITATANMLDKIREGDDTLQSTDFLTAQKSILEAAAIDAFDDVAIKTTEMARDPDAIDAAIVAPRAKFISTYLKSYFRHGNVVQLTLDTSSLKAKILEQLEKEFGQKLSESEIKKIADSLTSRLQSESFGTVSDAAFVARGGKKYAFQEIDIKVAPGNANALSASKISGTSVVADITRVVVEALMDAKHQLPTATGATGSDPKFDLGLVQNGIPCKDQASITPTCSRFVTADQFNRVESISSELDGLTLALVGTELRGVSWFSLNNEYLATFLETLTAATVRKESEKVAWCMESCTNHRNVCAGSGPVTEESLAPSSLSHIPTRRVNLKIEGK
jgi:hypothetical protein